MNNKDKISVIVTPDEYNLMQLFHYTNPGNQREILRIEGIFLLIKQIIIIRKVTFYFGQTNPYVIKGKPIDYDKLLIFKFMRLKHI